MKLPSARVGKDRAPSGRHDISVLWIVEVIDFAQRGRGEAHGYNKGMALCQFLTS